MAMTLTDLIEIRNAMAAAKEALHKTAMSEIHLTNSLYDELRPTCDAMYLPIAKLDSIIKNLTNKIEVEIK
jgi:hypothetical protein